MISKKPEGNQHSLSSYLDNYTDADGWKPNTSDKSLIQEAIQALDSAKDPSAQKIAALELIKSFDQNGINANEWLKANAQTSPYTPELMGVLKKLIGVWNRKLRGVKTYVYVNEIINFLIYDLHQKAPVEIKNPSEALVSNAVIFEKPLEDEEKISISPTSSIPNDNSAPLKFVTEDACEPKLNTTPELVSPSIQIPIQSIQSPQVPPRPVQTSAFTTGTELKLEPITNLANSIDRPMGALESALKKASQELSNAKLQVKSTEPTAKLSVDSQALDKHSEKMMLILSKMDQIINDFKELKEVFATDTSKKKYF